MTSILCSSPSVSVRLDVAARETLRNAVLSTAGHHCPDQPHRILDLQPDPLVCSALPELHLTGTQPWTPQLPWSSMGPFGTFH